MKIGHKLIAGFVGIALLVAIVGAIAVQQQIGMASSAAITEATHVADTAAYAITLENTASTGAELYRNPAGLENYVAQLHDLQERDIVVMDPHKTILADAIPENIGTVYDHDTANEIGQTITDGVPRTFLEVSVDYPAGIKEIVVPMKNKAGATLGAVIFEYTVLYDEMIGLAETTSYIVAIASLACLLLAILLGYLIARSISRPLNQLQEAMVDISGGNLDRVVPVKGGVEFRALALAFNQMTGQLSTARRQLVDVNQSLEQTVAERTAELSQTVADATEARAVAEQANRMKSQFLANMSHELRTPLNSIINFTRIILAGARGPVSEGQTDYLNRVRYSGEHLLGLINDILDLSKIEAGRMELFKEQLDPADLVQSVISTAVGLIKGKPVVLEQEIPADLPLIDADRTRVRQILLNLLSNAAKFTDQGSITVRVTRTDPFLTISVTDSGIGIPADQLETIFEEFRQVESDSNRAYGGTGLGLAICRSFVALHGGRIWVESTPNVGSTFSFTLPIAPVTVSAASEPALVETPAMSPHSSSILVIDDDPSSIEIVATYLGRDGYHIVGITDSRQAVAQARMLRPAAIILDVLMPYKDGWEILADFKADPDLAQVPVLLYTITEQQQLGYHLGASAYLLKPIDEEQLRTTLARLVAPHATIVVIDDDPNTLEIVTHHLEQSGLYRVVTASDGREGLARIAETKPNAIVLDLMMPDIDGFAVIEELGRDPLTSAIPVVVLSAKDLTLQERQQLNQRVSGLLAKGQSTPEQLLGKITDILAALAKTSAFLPTNKEQTE